MIKTLFTPFSYPCLQSKQGLFRNVPGRERGLCKELFISDKTNKLHNKLNYFNNITDFGKKKSVQVRCKNRGIL